MLSKIQKIWLWVFGAMFLVPEILWSPIANFYYAFSQSGKTTNWQPFRNNFLYDYKYENLFKAVILLQFISVIFFLILWIKNKKNINSKLAFWIVSFISLGIALIAFFVFSFVFTFHPDFIM